MQDYINVIKKYADFNGRASVREYWMFNLIHFIIIIILGSIGKVMPGTLYTIISVVYMIGVSLIPSIAVTVRRLHDTNRSGWYILLNIIPVLGWFYILYLTIKAGDTEKNRFGTSPITTN